MERITIAKEEDRLTVAAILIKNKYTVRMESVKPTGSRTYNHYLEYEPNPSATLKRS